MIFEIRCAGFPTMNVKYWNILQFLIKKLSECFNRYSYAMYRYLILTKKLNEKKHNCQACIIYKTNVRSNNHLISGIGCPTFCDVLFGQYGHYKNIFQCLVLDMMMSMNGTKKFL